MIDYSLLPYAPNINNMSGGEIVPVNFAKTLNHQNNRMPSIEEFKKLFQGSDYEIENETTSDKSIQLDIIDLYDVMDQGNIHVYYSQDHVWFSQATFGQALEISQMICSEFGPFYFGYNGFNEIFIIDADSDVEKIMGAPPGNDDAEFINYLKVHGMAEQTDPDTDPRIMEFRKENKYVLAVKTICNIIEDELKLKGYVRFGDLFYCSDTNIMKVINPHYAYWTDLKTSFYSATIGVMDKNKYEKAGIKIPEHPMMNYFKNVYYPSKDEVKRWGYKGVKATQITDIEWLERNKESIRNNAGFLIELVDFHARHLLK